MSPAIARKKLKLLSNSSEVKQEETLMETNLLPGTLNLRFHGEKGLDYKEIAQKLDSSPNTVRNQISSIY